MATEVMGWRISFGYGAREWVVAANGHKVAELHVESQTVSVHGISSPGLRHSVPVAVVLAMVELSKDAAPGGDGGGRG